MSVVRGQSMSNVVAERPSCRASRVGIILLVLSALFFGVNFTQEWWVTHGIEQSAAQLQRDIAATNAHNQQLRDEIVYVQSKEYIRRRARMLGMAEPGDTLAAMVVQQPRARIVRVYQQDPPPRNAVVSLLRTIFQ